MSKQSLIRRVGLVSLVGALVGPAASADAQSLETFLAAAAEHAIDVREAESLRDEAGSAVDEARARLLPSFTATGAYTRNEYEVIVTIPRGTGLDPLQATIAPYDQLTGTFTLNVPIVDVAAWETFFAAEASADAAGERAEGASVEAQVATATAYYQLVAAIAVRASAERAIGTAEDNVAFVTSRVTSGLASELDQARAEADLMRARQALAEAELQVILGTRNLFVLTGVTADPAALSLAEDALDVGPLEAWLAHAGDLPSVRAAVRDREAAERRRDAAWMGLLPVLSGSASERVTNAAGFGPEAQWSLGLTLSWTLDFGRPALIGSRDDAASTATTREERARTLAETQLIEAHSRIASLRARAEAARAGLTASERGARVAHARYEAGTGTALDVSNAERDLFAADVARIQAEAELLLQRAVLHLRAGVPLGGRP
jgi:outer membrane protein